ncbi:GTP-binding protein [Streptomyces sp. ME19-01-6]|uniref:GTP-binding protein n=1 Tax=Streptomyces sp. ME19-01-6 TaxID=3028686 RepID=UPI0029B54F23|nr:ATP/GTP-binding protein [Streptomyces sp. ME19-01-6]MDX3224504.1 ATP/GTP-binding protein [Streptomyces sp. ME19-01-6]
MDSAPFDPPADTAYLRGHETAVKIVIAGAFGVGKTTFIGSLSEIRPLRTEEDMTAASVGTDCLEGLPGKTSTTVAMDFGRLSLSDQLVLYLFGAPGQERFRRFLADLTRGALGALILVDTRRLEDSYDIIGRLEELGISYAIAVNTFPDAPAYSLGQLREAMDLPERTPLVMCDARERQSSRDALICLVEYLLTLHPEPAR